MVLLQIQLFIRGEFMKAKIGKIFHIKEYLTQKYFS